MKTIVSRMNQSGKISMARKIEGKVFKKVFIYAN